MHAHTECGPTAKGLKKPKRVVHPPFIQEKWRRSMILISGFLSSIVMLHCCVLGETKRRCTWRLRKSILVSLKPGACVVSTFGEVRNLRENRNEVRIKHAAHRKGTPRPRRIDCSSNRSSREGKVIGRKGAQRKSLQNSRFQLDRRTLWVSLRPSASRTKRQRAMRIKS